MGIEIYHINGSNLCVYFIYQTLVFLAILEAKRNVATY